VTSQAQETYLVTQRILAGKYPGAKRETDAKLKVTALWDRGVRTFVDLTQEGELTPYEHLLPAGAEYRRIAVRNVTSPSAEQTRQALAIIELGIWRGMVYVHCRGGCGRTGVVIGCYLVEQGVAPDKALARVHEMTRPLWSTPCPETAEQLDTVRSWTSSGRGTRRGSSTA
jgi:protein-tyrosine phosphatase